MDSRRRRVLWLIAIAIIGFLLTEQILSSRKRVKEVSYNTFHDYLAAGKIARVTVSGTSLRATLKAPLPGAAVEVSPPVNSGLGSPAFDAESAVDS